MFRGMRLRFARLGLALVLLATVACQAAPPTGSPAALAGPWRGDIAVHVTSNGWHTGVVVARAAMPFGAIPEADDFAHAPYLEFGWGDAEYYPAPKPTLGLALGAAFGANPAVVHMAGLPASPRNVYPNSEVIELGLSPESFRRLIGELDATFARSGGVRARASAPGLYSYSLFYPATGAFNLANTCNTWTARSLAAAGVPVDAAGVARAEEIMAQLRPLAVGAPRLR
jgi:uncharacterized protein (TIGR02117 family)